MNENDFEDLVDEVIFCAGDRVAAFEWGTAGAGHDKLLKEAKDAVLAEHKQLLKIIESVEWVEETTIDTIKYYCPWCGNYKKNGHSSDCKHQVALGVKNE